jgi:hypothetical protein
MDAVVGADLLCSRQFCNNNNTTGEKNINILLVFGNSKYARRNKH